MKKRLLVVDDDASVRESLRKVLEDSGYEVVLAADAEEAEGRFEAQEFELLVLDLNLPGRDGWDVLDYVSSCAPLLPVIVITGLVDQLATRIIPGVSALLTKPVEVPVMLKTIEDLLAATGEERLCWSGGYSEAVQSFASEALVFQSESGGSEAASTRVDEVHKAASTSKRPHRRRARGQS